MLSPRQVIFAFFKRIMVGDTIPRVTLRSTPGYEPLASLGHSTFGRAAVIGCGKLVIISRGWAAVVVGKNICEICEICVRFNHLQRLMQINNQQNLCEIELPAEVIVDEEKNNLWDM